MSVVKPSRETAWNESKPLSRQPADSPSQSDLWHRAARLAGLVLAACASLAGLYLARLYSYNLFHSLAEIFSVVIACGVFLFAWNSRRLVANGYLLYIGIAYLFTGAIDLVHTLAYKGMGVFVGFDTNLPTQLWIGARYLEALSLLIAPLFLYAWKLRPGLVFAVYTALVGIFFGSVFYWRVFPVCFVEGQGLTPFKVASEYVISLILFGAALFLWQKRERLDRDVFHLLLGSIGVTIAQELAFTLYTDPYGLTNMLGHILKIVAYYLVYRAIIATGLIKPFGLLLRDLQLTNERLSDASIRALEQAKRAREHAATAEAASLRVNTILESITDAFFALDREGRFTYVNAEAERLLRRSRADLLGARVVERFPEAAGTRFERELSGAMTTMTSVELVDFYPPLDASLEVHVYPSPEGLAVYFQDVTKQRRAEEALREGEERLRLFIENAPAAIAMLDGEMRYLAVSHRWLADYGLGERNIIGQSHYEIFPEITETWKAIHRRGLAGEVVRATEDRFDRADGAVQWLQWEVRPWRRDDGGVGGIVIFTEDISERKAADAERERLLSQVQDSERRFRSLFENSLDAILLTASDGSVFAANPAATQLFGYSEDELRRLGRAAVVGEQDPRVAAALEERAGTGKLRAQLPYRRKDGSTFEGEVSTAVFFDSAGEPNTATFVHDVTERKRAEQALADAERRYRELVQTAPAGIYEVDFRTRRFTSVNDAMCQMTGYSREELLGMSPFEILDEESRARFQVRIGRWLAGEEPENNVEFTVRTRDGGTIAALLNVTFTVDERGQPLGASVVAHDITDRKRIEDALRESERKYRELVQTAPAGIYEVDFRTRRFTSVNDAMCQMSGYSREELLTMNPLDILDEESRDRFQARVARWLDGEEPERNVEYKVKTKDGRTIDVILNNTFTADEDGRPLGASVIGYDITERKVAEVERERLLVELRGTLESLADGVIVYDESGRIVRMNHAAEQLTRYEPAEREGSLGERTGLLRFADSEGKPFRPEGTPVGRALRGEMVRGELIRMLRADQIHWLLAGAAPLRAADDRLLGAVVTLSDVTRLLELQAQQEEMLSLISHDLRNPLTALRGNAQMLERALAKRGLKREEESVAAILRSAQRMNSMIQDLVESTHLAAGRVELIRERVSLGALVLDVRDHLGSPEDRARIEVECPEYQPMVMIDRERFERVLVNLITNACKYSSQSDPIAVRVATSDDEVVVSVTDRGVGIPAEELSRVFEKYYRASTSRRAEGLGLGLYIARLIVEAHGGQIGVESRVGAGSTFTIRLPFGG